MTTTDVLDELIERVRTMPSNGVISRWENVSRSAVIDLVLEARAAVPAAPEPWMHPRLGAAALSEVYEPPRDFGEQVMSSGRLPDDLAAAIDGRPRPRSWRHRLGDLLGHRPGCDERCGHDRSCWP